MKFVYKIDIKHDFSFYVRVTETFNWIWSALQILFTNDRCRVPIEILHFLTMSRNPKKECMPLAERGKEYTLNCFYIGTYYWECIFLREIYMNHKLSDNDKMRFEKWIIGLKIFVARSLHIIPIHIPSSTSYSIFGTMNKVLWIAI